jgi:hypothetical protein
MGGVAAGTMFGNRAQGRINPASRLQEQLDVHNRKGMRQNGPRLSQARRYISPQSKSQIL